jgi:hypothetical protein
MKTATVHIPGNFEDSYVYMGWLVVLTAERSFRFYNLDHIVAEASKKVPESAYVADLMFRHNEWLTSAQFKALTRTASTKQNLLMQFDAFPQPYLELPTAQYTEHDIRVGTSLVLDYLIYNRQIYVGGKDGLFAAATDWEGDVPVVTAFDKRLDARCVNVTGRFGAIVASCGDDGLLWSLERTYPASDMPRKWGLAEDKSIRARWLSNDLINYKTTIDPDFLSIKKTKSPEQGTEDGDMVVSSIGEERVSLHHLLSQIRQHSPDLFDDKLIQYIFNSEKMVFVFTLDGQFFSLDVKRHKNAPLQLKYSHTDKGAGVRILSAATTKLGAVLETDKKVLHFAEGRWTTVLDSPALAVRTFPHAKNFHNLVSITSEDGVYLTGLFDDTLRLVTM